MTFRMECGTAYKQDRTNGYIVLLLFNIGSETVLTVFVV